MSDRIVEYCKDERCDQCYHLGAYDFMGDLLCDGCFVAQPPEYLVECSGDKFWYVQSLEAENKALRQQVKELVKERDLYKSALDRADKATLLASAIAWWQTNPEKHSLTCGNNSSHAPLYFEGHDKLKCHDCNYIQTHIPEDVLLGAFVYHTLSEKQQKE